MSVAIDNLYKIYDKAREVADETGDERLREYLSDEINPWLHSWMVWEESGSDPRERPSNEYRPVPSVAALNKELAFVGYKGRGGKNPKVWKI